MTSETESTPVKSKKRRLLLSVLISMILLVAVLLAFLPSILSMDWCRRAVVDKVNATGNGKLAVDSWSLSWLSGNSIKGLTFADSQGVNLVIKEIKMSQGLLGLVGRKMNLGTIIISSPEILIVPSQKDVSGKTVPAQKADEGKNVREGGGNKSSVSSVTAKPSSASVKPVGPIKIPVDVAGTIKVENGKASVQSPGIDRKYDFEKINCVIAITSLNMPVNIEAGFCQVGGGAFRLGGSAKVLEDGIFDPAKVVADITAEVVSLDLAPFGAIASARANMPDIKGTLDTRLSVKITGVDKISADGSINLSNVLLSGGPLGRDKPKMNSAKLEFNILVDSKNISIRNFKLNSPFLTARASGELVDKGTKYPAGNIVMNAVLDIPYLATQMPATLRVEKGTVISKGNISTKMEIQSAGDNLSCLVDARLADLEARIEDKVMTLSHPVQLESKVVLTADELRIEKCLFSSSFVNMSGHGDLKDMQVTLNADIALAMAEARKFMALGKLSAAGKISAVSRIQSASATERKVTTRMTVDEFKVSGAGPNPFVLDTARAGLDMLVKTTPEGKVTEISGVKLSLDSAPVSAKVTIAGIVPGDKPENSEVRGLEFKAQADVKNIFAMGHGMGVIPVDNDGAGTVDIAAGGKMDKSLLALAPVSVDVANLKLSVKGKKLSEPRVSVKCSIDQDIASGDIAVKNLKVESSILALTAQGSLTDIKKEKVLLLDGVQTCDFKRIGEIVTAMGGNPVEMEGKREKKFHIKAAVVDSDWKKILRKTDANIGLYLGKIKTFGVQVEGLEFSALAGKGLVRTDINTKVNDGDLKMKPEVNAASDEAFLSIPDGSLVLKNVKITESMMSDLIAKVHPLLRGCAVTSGKTDLLLNKCYVPLDPKMKNRIIVEGDLMLTNLVIEPGGTLKELLSLTGQELKPLVVSHEVISFVCRDGKLTPSPLTIGNSDYRMTLTGFVTLDGMMKFVAQVPLTSKMMGKKIGQYVKDVVVKVPIEGPVAKPVISGDAIKSALADVTKDAARSAIKEEGGKLLKDVLKKKGVGSFLDDVLK